MRQAINDNRGKIHELLARWESELTDAERSEIKLQLENLEKLEYVICNGNLRGIDETVYQADEAIRHITIARDYDALLTALIVSTGRYLSEEQLNLLKGIQQQLSNARMKGARLDCIAIVEATEAGVRALGVPILMIAYLKTCITQHRLSSDHVLKMQAALQMIDEGLSKDNYVLIRKGVTETEHIINEVLQNP